MSYFHRRGDQDATCRSIERLLNKRSQERVQSIVAEAYHDDYWYAASRDGNRTSHYRGESCHMYDTAARLSDL